MKNYIIAFLFFIVPTLTWADSKCYLGDRSTGSDAEDDLAFKLRAPETFESLFVIQKDSSRYQRVFLSTLRHDLIVLSGPGASTVTLFRDKITENGNIKGIFIDYVEMVVKRTGYVEPVVVYCPVNQVQIFIDKIKDYVSRTGTEVSYEKRYFGPL